MKEQDQAKNVLTQLDDRLYKIESTINWLDSIVHGYVNFDRTDWKLNILISEIRSYRDLLSKVSVELNKEIEPLRLLLYEATKNPIVIAAIKSILEAEKKGQLGNHTAPVMRAIIDENKGAQ